MRKIAIMLFFILNSVIIVGSDDFSGDNPSFDFINMFSVKNSLLERLNNSSSAFENINRENASIDVDHPKEKQIENSSQQKTAVYRKALDNASSAYDKIDDELKLKISNNPDENVTVIITLYQDTEVILKDIRENVDPQFSEMYDIWEEIRMRYKEAQKELLKVIPQEEWLINIDHTMEVYMQIVEHLGIIKFVNKSNYRIDELHNKYVNTVQQVLKRNLAPIQNRFINRVVRLQNTRINDRLYNPNMIILETTASNIPYVSNVENVLYIEETSDIVSLLDISAPSILATAAWNSGITGGNFDAAVIDTGITQNHPAFNGVNMITQTYCSTNINDPNGHGTAVAGILASNNPIYRGISYGLGTLYVGKHCGSNNQVQTLANWAISYSDKPEVISISSGQGCNGAGTSSYSNFVDSFVDNNQINWVNAVGNVFTQGCSSSYCVFIPSDAYNVISVGNIDDRNTISRSDDYIDLFSCTGPTTDNRIKPDLVAPGEKIRTTNYLWNSPLTADFTEQNGTSFAAPHVSASIVLLSHAGLPYLPIVQRALLINTADDFGPNGPDNYYGFGYINLDHALLHQNDVYTDTITQNQVKFYSANFYSPDHDKTTLIWNRHFGVSLSNLNIYAYNNNGISVGNGGSSINDNREHIYNLPAGNHVVKVKAFIVNGPSAEQFAISLEGNSNTLASPSLSVSLTGPPSGAAAGQQFQINVQPQNTGQDLKLFNVMVQLSAPQGFSIISTNPVNVGTINPSSSTSVSFTIQANIGVTSGTHQFSATVFSNSWGENFITSGNGNIQILYGPGQNCNSNSQCVSGYCQGSSNNPARCCSGQPPGDGWNGGGNIGGCSNFNDPSSQYRDYYCDSSGNAQYELTNSFSCNWQDGW